MGGHFGFESRVEMVEAAYWVLFGIDWRAMVGVVLLGDGVEGMEFGMWQQYMDGMGEGIDGKG